jgi:polyhydroxybutyrate depolymerase
MSSSSRPSLVRGALGLLSVSVALLPSCGGHTHAASTDADPPDTGTRVDANVKDGGHDVVLPHDASMGCQRCDAGEDTGHDSGGSMGTKDSGHDTGMPAMGKHSSGVAIKVTAASGMVMRTYSITLPAVCDSSNPLPLVFAFHGDGGNGEGMYSSFPIEAAAAAAGGKAIFVYPDGLNDNIDPGGVARAWDLYHDPGPPPYTYTPGQPAPPMSDEVSGNLDIDFFDAMVETFEQNYCVDTSRVWVTGMSSGGYLSNQFGRWRSTIINAIAPQSGGMPFGNMDSQTGTWIPPNYCVGPTNPVPALIIHGLSDGTVDPCNALEAQSYWDTANLCPDSADNCGTNSDSCTGTKFAIPAPAPTTTSSLNSDCTQTTGCGANPVVLCQVPGMGHDIWSEAPQVIWSFFTGL